MSAFLLESILLLFFLSIQRAVNNLHYLALNRTRQSTNKARLRPVNTASNLVDVVRSAP